MMPLLKLFTRGGPPRQIEYGPDGSPTGGFDFTPWPGIIEGAVDIGTVSYEDAMGLPGVGRGVELVAGVMSQLNPLLYKAANKIDVPTELIDTPELLLNPDPWWHGRATWLAGVTSSLMMNGNAFAYSGPEVCNDRGYPTRLPLIPAEDVIWDGRAGSYQIRGTGGVSDVAQSDMKHFVVNPRIGYKMGEGILDRYQTQLKTIKATESAAYVVMSQGRPVGVLSSSIDISEAEATAGKQAFLKAMQDSSVAMLYNVDFKPVQWNANDLALVPTREYNLRLASDITGVSPYLLGVPSESRVYSNMETEWANFIKVTLGKYINSIEQVLSTCFPRDKTVRFYIDELLRGDSSQRWATYEKAINLGVMTAAEVRELEGRGVAEDLEEPPPPEPTAEADPAQPEDGDENA